MYLNKDSYSKKDLIWCNEVMRLKRINTVLLEACKMMLRLIEGEGLDEKFDGESEVLRDAISQAEGRDEG